LKVLITGATGFIGQHVARRFAAGGAEVFALVRAPGDRLDLQGVAAIEGDLTDRKSLGALERLPDLDVLCHLAADTRMDASAEELEANVTGTTNLMAAVGEHLRGGRVLYASSIAAVDRSRRPRGPLTDADTPAPRTPYGLSKLRGEEVLEAEARARSLALTSLRLGTVYGPGATKGGVLQLAEAVEAGSLAARIRWPGRISFVHTDDVAEVFWRLAERDEPLSGAFLTAEDRGWTMAELAEILRGVKGATKGPIPLPVACLKLGGAVLSLPGIRRLAPWSLRCALMDTILCDPSRLTDALDMSWIPLTEGVERTFSTSSGVRPSREAR